LLLLGGPPLAAAENTVIKNLLTGDRLRELGVPPGDLMLLKDFYQRRRYAPAWQLQDSGIESVVKEFISFMRATLETHGLNENAYPFNQLLATLKEGGADAIEKGDVIASAMVLRMARTLSGQDSIPQSDDGTWPLRRAKTDIATGLNAAVARQSVPEYL